MGRRLNVIAPILVSAIGLVLLPVTVNVASSALPGSWHRYLWLSWPAAGLLAALLVAIESRRSRKAHKEPNSHSDVTADCNQPAVQTDNSPVPAKPSVVVHVVAQRDAYTADRMTVIKHGEDDHRLKGGT